jgi:hypothetical protein
VSIKLQRDLEEFNHKWEAVFNKIGKWLDKYGFKFKDILSAGIEILHFSACISTQPVNWTLSAVHSDEKRILMNYEKQVLLYLLDHTSP